MDVFHAERFQHASNERLHVEIIFRDDYVDA